MLVNLPSSRNSKRSRCRLYDSAICILTSSLGIRKKMMASVGPDNVDSCDTGAQRNTPYHPSVHLWTVNSLRLQSYTDIDAYVPFPLTVGFILRIFKISRRTFLGHVADKAMIGTPGTICRRMDSFW